MKPAFLSAAGNRFVVVDGLPDDPALLCGETGVDGVLALVPALAGGDVGMRVYNKDGGEAEACGNGLRCAALWAREEGRAASDDVRVETVAGLRRVQLLRAAGAVRAARAEMGRARVVLDELELDGEVRELARVELGNPHAVFFVEDERHAPVERIGALLQSHPSFERGVNAGFAAVRANGLALRVFERGVGETAACGTGACAAAAAALARGLARLPLAVQMPGGTLLVGADSAGGLWLEGPVIREPFPTPSSRLALPGR